MPEPTFGVVLLNWNGCDDTLAALESLVAADPRPASVVVVDNGSSDDSVARIVAWGEQRVTTALTDADAWRTFETPPWLLVVAAGANRGFSSGNNIGLEYLATRTDVSHFLLLNNDAMVAPDYFARVADALRDRPELGVTGALIHYHPDRDRVWYAGGFEVPWRALMLHRYDAPATDAPYATEFVTGCAMMIARPVYAAIGGLATCYDPIYWEDADYSMAARRAGWKLAVIPTARVFHRVGASGGGERITPRVAYWQNRNRGLYVRRNYRGTRRIAALAYLLATKPGRAVVELLRGRPAMASAIARGYVRGMAERAA